MMCECCCYWEYSSLHDFEHCCFLELHKENDISPCEEYENEDTEEKISFKKWMMLHHKDLMKK